MKVIQQLKGCVPPASNTSAILACAVLTSIALAGAVAAAPDSAMGMSMADPVTGTKYKTTSDMAIVLTTLKGLGGKPIETLTPAEARQQGH